MMPGHPVFCRHCGRILLDTSGVDPNVPWVHKHSGNSFCDVDGAEDAVRLRGTPERTEAWPA